MEYSPTLAPRRGKPEEAMEEGPRGANWPPLDLKLQSSPKRAEKVAETPSGGKEGMWKAKGRGRGRRGRRRRGRRSGRCSWPVGNSRKKGNLHASVEDSAYQPWKKGGRLKRQIPRGRKRRKRKRGKGGGGRQKICLKNLAPEIKKSPDEKF